MKSGQKEFRTLKIAKLEKVNVLTEGIKKSLTLVTNEELAPVIYDRKTIPYCQALPGRKQLPTHFLGLWSLSPPRTGRAPTSMEEKSVDC